MHEKSRDALIDRYVGGLMSPSEEEEFLRMAGNDPDLRHLVKAERIVRANALQWREKAIPQSPFPSHLMELLAATSVTSATPVTSKSAVSKSTASKSASFLSGRLLHGVIAAIGVGCLAVGTFVIAPLIHTPQDAPRPRIDRTTPEAATPEASRSHAGPSPTRPPAMPSRANRPGTVIPREHPLTDSFPQARRQPISTPEQAAPSQENLPVIVRDSLQLRMKIDSSPR